ncbi:hypothetical protein FKW77_003871 [Venturia effusa]|uniref:Uncharacterized protein n=1 Tax=Venturia effusa TaxID=50376 RepID=A0A517LIP0_9PEZI|nr:hypothetical protein FKW77_003871 [Venturia effusa]
MRVAATITALLLGARAYPTFSSDDEEKLNSIEEMVHRLVDHQNTASSTISLSNTTATDRRFREPVAPPPGLISVSDPRPVSDCLHRWQPVDPYRMFFYVPPAPYGYLEQPNVKLVVSLSTRWGIYYTKQLRKKIEKETGLVSVKAPLYSSCGWSREMSISAAGVHRGDIDITRDGNSAVHMNAELKQKLERILRTTYPGVEIFLVLLFTVPLLMCIMWPFWTALWRAMMEKRRKFQAKGKLGKVVSINHDGLDLELHGVRNTVPVNGSASSVADSSLVSLPPSYRM